MDTLKRSLICTLIFIMPHILSCSKDNDNPPVIDVNVDIKYMDVEGNNILTEDYIKDLKVFHLVDGELIPADLSKGHPTGFEMFNDASGEATLRIFPYAQTDVSSSTTVLKFGNLKQDTITSFLINPNKNSIVSTKVNYNSNVEWEANNNSYPDSRIINIVD